MKKSFLLLAFLSSVMFYGIHKNSDRLKETFGQAYKQENAFYATENSFRFVKREDLIHTNKAAVICIKINECYYCRTASDTLRSKI